MSNPSAKPWILVDGSSYLYRAFHALPPLTNSQGQPTGAIYGVINMLRKLLVEYTPDHIAVVFDSKAQTFRDELYPAYKANRTAMPEELQTQIAPLHAIIQAMGIPLLIVDGVEADDVIGTLAQRAVSQHHSVIISTSDKDFAQLVNERITLINTMSNTQLDSEGVQQKFGVAPAQIIDYLMLIGDNSDNVPGVPSVGPKTAAKWLQQYGSLEKIIAHQQEISGKVGEQLRQHIPTFELSRALITIRCNVELPIEFESLHLRPADKEKLHELFSTLEFKSWLAEQENSSEKKTSTAKNKIEYHCVIDANAFQDLLAKLEAAPLFAFDTETTSLHIREAEIVGVSFAIEPREAWYIPLAHDYMGAPSQLSRETVLNRLKPILENPQHQKIAQHVKYDLNVLRNHGIHLQGIAYDTMLESYVLNSTRTRHDMDSLAAEYLHKKTIKFEDIAGKGAKQLTFNQIDIAQATQYAAEDADITLQLHEKLWPKLEQHPQLKNAFAQIEMPLALVLADMEYYGVLIDANLLREQSMLLAKRIQELEIAAYQEADTVFNLASPKQLQEILYTKLKLPILEKTPSGQPSTAESVLQELAPHHRLPQLLLEHRSLSKLKSTYTDKLPQQIHPKSGRVHTSYQQAVVATGRLSSSNPNLQNIPIRTEEGRRIRQAFIAPARHKILSADYSQIELRLMAHLSQDTSLLQAFAEDLDIHRATAAEIFNIPLKEVTGEQRRYAKTINFGLIYGMSAFGLAKQLGMEKSEAQNYIDTYFARYPGVKHYMESTRKLAHQQGYVTTLSGRQLYLPEINARNQMRQKAAERAAINAPLQGSAADLIKLAMIELHRRHRQGILSATMMMQVHDELVFEVPEHDLDVAKQQIQQVMENIMILAVPLRVSIGIGANWDEAH